jgi:hypothetical protein
MKFVLIAVALLDDLRCGSKVGGAPRLGIGASGVGAVKETEIYNLREVAMSLLGTVVSGRRFSFSGQSHCRGDPAPPVSPQSQLFKRGPSPVAGSASI